MKNFRNIILLSLVFILAGAQLFSQQNYVYTGTQLNTITTAVPFLLIAPDARSGGLGEAGVSTSPDDNSQFWNPAKYAFAKKRMGVSISYSPWLRALVKDRNYGYCSMYFKPDSNQCVAASFRAISLGLITFTDVTGTVVGSYRPFEYAADISYTRKLSETFSAGLSLRYIHSNLTGGIFIGGAETHPGVSVAGDISLFYTKPLNIFNEEGRINIGMNISNIGSKISYTETTQRDFIPTRLMLGPTFILPIAHRASVAFTVEASKLLVPTPPVYYTDSTGQHILAGKNPNVSVLQGMMQSFYDAPGGYREELKEIDISSGIELRYDDMFALRAGFFYEDSTKGDRQFFTLGIGLRYNFVAFDISYLLPLVHFTTPNGLYNPFEPFNPLNDTFRFTLSFNFDSFRRKTAVCAGVSNK